MKADKQLLSEIAAKHVLESKLGDVFVEGESDVGVFRSFSALQGIKEVDTWSIDYVDVPQDLLERHRLPPGSNRSKVIAAALELEKMGVSPMCRIRCAIDSDLDTVLNLTPRSTLLLRTDFPSIESYALDQEVITRFVYQYARAGSVQPEHVAHAVSEACRWLFALRLARESASSRLEFPALAPSCSVVGDSLHFDRADFLDRWIGKNGHLRDEVVRSSSAWLEKLVGDRRLYAHGHDLVDLLTAWMRSAIGSNLAAARKQCGRVLLGLLMPSHLASHALFIQLTQAMSGTLIDGRNSEVSGNE